MFRRTRTALALLVSLGLVAFFVGRGKSDINDPERGDVPGWVMITMMSAVLVAAILAIAQPALTEMFKSALAMVHP